MILPQKTSKPPRGTSKHQQETNQPGGNRLHLSNHAEFAKLQNTINKLNTKTTKDPNNYVINLTKKSFSKNEFKLLNKNLNYVPNPGKPNKKDFKNDTNNFFKH